MFFYIFVAATFVYQAFVSFAYFFPLIGSLLADSFLGKFKVILYGSVIYVVGHLLLSLGAIPTIDSVTRAVFDFAGLFVIAMATGAIKPCVSAFAADQFRTDQEELRSQFFSFFYLAINCGSLFAIFLTPILRGRVSCLGSEYCFPLAFGVPGVLMVLALVLFLCGWKIYTVQPPAKENILFEVVGCIWTAATRSFFSIFRGNSKPVDHWLERSAPNYPPQVIKSVRLLCNIAILFAPITLFWSLLEQQGSTWVLQTQRLNGRVGWVTILPEQAHILNPLLVIILVPVFEAWIYPGMKKIVHVTPLRKMAVGGLLAAVAFMLSGALQLQINKTLEAVPDDGQIFFHNIGMAETFSSIRLDNQIFAIQPGRTQLPAGIYTLNANGAKLNINMSVPTMGYVIGLYEHDENLYVSQLNYSVEKTANGGSKIYVLVPSAGSMGNLFVINGKGEVVATCALKTGEHVDVLPALIGDPNYKLYFGANCRGSNCSQFLDFEVQTGSKHVLNVMDGMTKTSLREIVAPNTVSILWIIPQYIVLTLAEILVSVTGLEFAYSQSSPKMTSVMQAVYLMTIFLGNVITMILSGTHAFADPAVEFFFYAVMMLMVMGVFIILAMRYTYVDDEKSADLQTDHATLSDVQL